MGSMVDTVTLSTSAMFHEDTCWLKLFILTRHWTDLGFFFFFITLTMSTRRVRPIGMRCLLLFLCSFSYLYLIRGPCCSALNVYFFIWIFKMVRSSFLSISIILYYWILAIISVINSSQKLILFFIREQ